ncbi:26S proteasome regulatory subunit-like protein [Emericellopsis atlantica]|uniref:26S proteasome regulatory subunit-like protein n=1 Tax=Emericellopsis atlantica TaxID=2614577 RepID=A0A9P7ZF50_9HYPO|nr:26S proteasome regulatory subunit-like protein [Emericellopsis atlantica]KAG9250796.1 26S proteasome regulatory subunit-like protein [Emericellopsis atlantica]
MLSVSHPQTAHRPPQHQHQQPDRASTAQTFDFGPAASSFGAIDPINSLTSGSLPNPSMPNDNWGNLAQHNPEKMGRMPHQRESSLSSMGSAGPASPYNQSTSNPQIAITDSTGDDLTDIHTQDASSQNSQLFQVPKSAAGTYTGYQSLEQAIPDMAYPATIPGPGSNQSRTDRGLLPAPDMAMASRSHPPSVASSVTGDSPATATAGSEDVGDRRRKDGYGNVPKLDRTMTDVYGDELYSPNFAITSTPPSQPQGLTTISPPSEIFSQRLNAANSQHLGMAHSPASVTTADHKISSPFRPSSPFAKTSGHDPAPSRVKPHDGGDRVREFSSMRQDAPVFRSQSLADTEPETPKTISPKDAMLEFNDPEGDADFPLFPQSSMALDMEQLPKSMSLQAPQQSFMPGANGMGLEQFGYVPNSQITHNLQVPQQYPFVPRLHPGSAASPPRLSSSGSSPDSVSTINPSANIRRPARAGAEGGTYTCTYHGCKQRFETPVLLQKHKREGHRQTHGLIPTQPEIGMATSLVNSQAGPHRCDRINPSTGKPCNTVFSRPYDLTRHEDTIHNARKQKVRCDLCTEEKTFSRADALTRHYRVCHPDMELPGKSRRRGGA